MELDRHVGRGPEGGLHDEEAAVHVIGPARVHGAVEVAKRHRRGATTTTAATGPAHGAGELARLAGHGHGDERAAAGLHAERMRLELLLLLLLLLPRLLLRLRLQLRLLLLLRVAQRRGDGDVGTAVVR